MKTQKSGLNITPRTKIDRNILDNFFETSIFLAEYNVIEDYFFLPEEEENYDELENELQEEFIKLNVNVQIEGVF